MRRILCGRAAPVAEKGRGNLPGWDPPGAGFRRRPVRQITLVVALAMSAAVLIAGGPVITMQSAASAIRAVMVDRVRAMLAERRDAPRVVSTMRTAVGTVVERLDSGISDSGISGG